MSTLTASSENRDEVLDRGEPALSITDLRKYFALSGGRNVTAVDDISLTVDRGEFVVLLGPSGCGKTTLLRCVAGLESPDLGRIDIGGRTMFDRANKVDRSPEKRGLSMVFQTYALWPHLTAAQNVAYPLKSRKDRRSDTKARVDHVLGLVGVRDQSGRYPSQMSGGQQQRVALARALAPNSDLVLFDEPLSNIDAKVREELRLELLEMQRSIQFTALYVTHDQDEAMQLAHRIVVLHNGRIEQVGTPREVYEDPASLYVSRFIGQANEVPGTVKEVRSDSVAVETEFGVVAARRHATAPSDGEQVVLVSRPEGAAIVPAGEPTRAGALTFDGEVTSCSYAGTHLLVAVRAGETKLMARVPVTVQGVQPGDTVRVQVPADRCVALPREQEAS